MIPTSRRFIKDALICLFRRQTAIEQIGGYTIEENGIGFNGADASFGTSLAEHVLAGRSLTPQQLTAAYKMLQKYRRQLQSELDFTAYPDDPKPHSQDSKGILFVREGKLCFYPRIYPSTSVKRHGFSWDKENEYWVAEFSLSRVYGVQKDFEPVTIDDSCRAMHQEVDTIASDTALNRQVVEVVPWKQKPGWLQIIDGRLWFMPLTYPTTQLKNTGWFYKALPEASAKLTNSGKGWVAELGMENLNLVRRHWPDVNFHPTVVDWMQSEDTLTVAGIFHTLRSTQGFELKPYQKEAAALAVGANRAMISLAPGLGKTPTAIAACVAAGARNILVVAPLSLLRNWEREIGRWDKDAHVAIWHGRFDYLTDDEQRFYAVTNYETMVKYKGQLVTSGFDTFILDESTLIKNWRKPKTKKGADGEKTTKISVQRGQAAIEIAQGMERFWELSGGPATRFLDDLWAQFYAINSKRFGSYWRFAERYCEIEKSKWGWRVTANKPNAAEQIRRDYSDIYFARTQDQVENLPPWLFETIEVDMTEEQAFFYDQLQTEMMAEIEGMGDSAMIGVDNILALITRSIQAASNPALVEVERDGAVMRGPDSSGKWAAALDLLPQYPGPYIIWTNYIRTGQHFGAVLAKAGYSVGVLTGQTKAELRQDWVDQFQEGQIDVLVAHPAVGKYGLTLTAARTAVYLERSYNGDDYFQSLHRVRRIGSQHSCNILHLLSTYPNGAPTIDHVIDGILDYRTETVKRLTAGEFKVLL